MNSSRVPPDFAVRARSIKFVLTDCDGVLTDAGVYYSEHGEAMKRFNVRDGMGVERLRVIAGIETAIISGEISSAIRRRAEKLAILECHLGARFKDRVITDMLERLSLGSSQIAYIGDDVNDLPAFALAGLTACTADAFEKVKESADVVLTRPGGEGAFREFAELILNAWVQDS